MEQNYSDIDTLKLNLCVCGFFSCFDLRFDFSRTALLGVFYSTGALHFDSCIFERGVKNNSLLKSTSNRLLYYGISKRLSEMCLSSKAEKTHTHTQSFYICSDFLYRYHHCRRYRRRWYYYFFFLYIFEISLEIWMLQSVLPLNQHTQREKKK